MVGMISSAGAFIVVGFKRCSVEAIEMGLFSFPMNLGSGVVAT